MQRENRIFAHKMTLARKFANFIFGIHCVTITYIKIDVFNPFFSAKKRGENREKSKETIGAFSKYLRILGEVS